MSKNCVPVEFEEYLLRMFQQTFYLLQKITKENNAHTVKSRLEELDERYEGVMPRKRAIQNLCVQWVTLTDQLLCVVCLITLLSEFL